MFIFYSVSKTFKLRRISKVLGRPFNVKELYNEMIINRDKPSRLEKAKEELYDLCIKDPNVKLIMKKYQADRQTLKNLYNRISIMGGGQWVGWYFVAASALAYQNTLDYLLRNYADIMKSNDSALRASVRLVEHFQSWNVGYIKD